MIRRLVTVGVALGAVAIASVVPETQPRFRSGTDAVLVDVQVTAGGQPVVGLTAADFEVRDSGVRQQVDVVSFADVPISLLLALDVSSSVEGERLDQLKAAAREALAALRPGDQAAVLTFTDRISRLSGWTSDLSAVERRIGTLQPHGWTALYDAVASAVSLREQASGRVVVLVFSDGADTASWLDAPTVIEAARHSDVVVTAVSAAPRVQTASGREARMAFGLEAALRRWFDTDPALFPYAFLEVLTEETGGQYLHVASDREISGAFRRIIAGFKTRYLLTYPPKGVPASGWHPLEVRVTTRRAEVKARRGYWR